MSHTERELTDQEIKQLPLSVRKRMIKDRTEAVARQAGMTPASFQRQYKRDLDLLRSRWGVPVRGRPK
jgi:AraC-like DNA-binding protein